ncbi:putative mRNA 3 -end-processing protein RNA14 [Rosellinia necatrix]|uniref:mRNA 3'-end-processing protein RNA14 n=1 Tax=Rosellinia necatrix TaxID=77044 RepID=A0A1W2TJY7_ROSNE|nr:putative mRNA 3 -end-processing protein RNA14 [Rosellinia necatrix]
MASDGASNADAQLGGNAAWADGGWSGNVETNGSNRESGDGEEQYSANQPDPASDGSEDTADMDEEEDSAEYDPESVEITTTPYNPESIIAAPILPAGEERSASAASSRRAKKPKTAGGFIVGSSDDEDDAPTPPKLASTDLQPRAFTRSPLQQITTVHEVAAIRPAQSSNGALSATDHPAIGGTNTKSRLPTDVMGMLEDRIKEDPKGDIEAWFALIEEQKRRHKVDDTKNTYERFLEIFPQAAEVWVAYLGMELSLDNFPQAEGLFNRTLFAVPHVQLWTAYLNYVRRRNDLNDPSGQARQTVSQAYEFVLNNIGQDRDAGTIWQDYISFIKSGPGQLGGTSWQDQQKMDLLRKAYQRAICVPTANLNIFWKEYDQFELGLNKMTGRKYLQERSPAYMTARSANTALENVTRGLKRTTLPRLPPVPGFDGDQQFLEQVKLWMAWVAWEKDDPLVLKSEDLASYQQRILHVYKHALMALRFWPEMWVSAAEWCFENKIVKDGKDVGLSFLIDGVTANPESALLALKHADYIELTQRAGEDEQAKASLAQAVRAPYDKVLDTLYEMIKKLKDKESSAIASIRDAMTESVANETTGGEEDDDEGEIKENPTSTISRQDRIKAVQDGFAVQIQMLSQQISYLWIALARAFRRFQGQGKSSPPTGLRGIFTEARGKGRLTSEVYIAIAHIEWDVYQDSVATKIFERGSRLFPESEHFFVEYLKHLHARRDFTNARVVFSQTVKRFKEKPELTPKLKPLYAYFHAYEARYGELSQVQELEKQMAELFPDESSISPFAARFATDRFNPITARVIVSVAQQMRPKTAILQSVEDISPSVRATPQPIPQAERSPRQQFLPVNAGNINSPKRPFQNDETDDYNPPRKIARGVSPLKGAAGRRLDQQRRQGATTASGTTIPIPRDITFLLGLIPPADTFHTHRFKPERMVQLIRETEVPSYSEWRTQTEQSRGHMRPASSDYVPHQYSGRDSPGITGRPASPYGGASRAVAQASTAYRNSPLRPGSSGSYEPPPAIYQAPGPSPFNPIAQHSQGAPGNPYAGWQNNYTDMTSQYSGSHPAQSQPYPGQYY